MVAGTLSFALMTRETSIQAYYKVKESGLLSTVRLKVYEILCYHGPMTAMELAQHTGHKGNSGVYTTRLSELERMGAITTIGERPCSTTGHTALVWEITHRMPTKHPKRITKQEKKDRVIVQVEQLRNIIHPMFNGKLDAIIQFINEI